MDEMNLPHEIKNTQKPASYHILPGNQIQTFITLQDLNGELC